MDFVRHADAASLRDRLRRLGGHLTALQSAGFVFGTWEPDRADDTGVRHMPSYRFSPAAEALLRDARALVQPFDWPTWLGTGEGARLRKPEAVASANAEGIQRLVTAIIRSERFSEGSIAGAYESGLLTAVVRRAAELGRDPG